MLQIGIYMLRKLLSSIVKNVYVYDYKYLGYCSK